MNNNSKNNDFTLNFIYWSTYILIVMYLIALVYSFISGRFMPASINTLTWVCIIANFFTRRALKRNKELITLNFTLPTLQTFKVNPQIINNLDTNLKNQYNAILSNLEKINFQIIKESNYSTTTEKLESFLVDDQSKKIAIVNGFYLTVIPFSDISSANINQYSTQAQETLISKRTYTHTSIIINLKNNLQTPNITINFVNLHKSAFPNIAYDIKGALDYIQDYNKNNQA